MSRIHQHKWLWTIFEKKDWDNEGLKAYINIWGKEKVRKIYDDWAKRSTQTGEATCDVPSATKSPGSTEQESADPVDSSPVPSVLARQSEKAVSAVSARVKEDD